MEIILLKIAGGQHTKPRPGIGEILVLFNTKGANSPWLPGLKNTILISEQFGVDYIEINGQYIKPSLLPFATAIELL